MNRSCLILEQTSHLHLEKTALQAQVQLLTSQLSEAQQEIAYLRAKMVNSGLEMLIDNVARDDGGS